MTKKIILPIIECKNIQKCKLRYKNPPEAAYFFYWASSSQKKTQLIAWILSLLLFLVYFKVLTSILCLLIFCFCCEDCHTQPTYGPHHLYINCACQFKKKKKKILDADKEQYMEVRFFLLVYTLSLLGLKPGFPTQMEACTK